MKFFTLILASLLSLAVLPAAAASVIISFVDYEMEVETENFDDNGDPVFFDDNGDPIARGDLYFITGTIEADWNVDFDRNADFNIDVTKGFLFDDASIPDEVATLQTTYTTVSRFFTRSSGGEYLGSGVFPVVFGGGPGDNEPEFSVEFNNSQIDTLLAASAGSVLTFSALDISITELIDNDNFDPFGFSTGNGSIEVRIVEAFPAPAVPLPATSLLLFGAVGCFAFARRNKGLT